MITILFHSYTTKDIFLEDCFISNIILTFDSRIPSYTIIRNTTRHISSIIPSFQACWEEKSCSEFKRKLLFD